MTDKTPNSSGLKLPSKQLMSCGDISCELLVDPIPRPAPEPIKVTLKPKQQRVVLVDHLKPNSMAILKLTQTILRERGVVVNDEILVKEDASRPMTAAMLDSLSREGGLVLCGISD
ncbi:hypothetical protein N9P24_00475 [bacterium]|nr:hypothetical protein [bacterium]